MRAYRDALDRHRIPWADDTQDTERVGGYRLRIERTVTVLDEHRVSVIWGYQLLPGREPTGVSIGYPDYLEVQYDPVSSEPFMATPGDILADIFGVRGESSDECRRELRIVHEWENEQAADERMICPYCEGEISDSWEYEEGESEIVCPSCDRTFEAEISSVRTYRTRRRIEDMPDGWNGGELL